HLFKPENEHVITEWQKRVDRDWDYLQRREAARV
ncbi:MAG: pyruvate ferredoxin oxidoreductase, partial [Arcobacter sp.]|nr:pyruvate ferredoxin oxidoreductase [Arcobacter sp.]